MAAGYEYELEWEMEDELSHEYEDEFTHELSHEFEDEYEGEEFLGTPPRGVGGLYGAGELEGELSYEYEDELSHELSHEFSHEFSQEAGYEIGYEYEGEQFFGKLRRIARGVTGFVRRMNPVLTQIARTVAPKIAAIVGGPLGGAIGSAATSALGEYEYGEYELQETQGLHELSHEYEGALHESAYQEIAHEVSNELQELSQHEATAELMASVAARAQSEMEAEAMAGASAALSLSRSDRMALRRLVPHLVRGAAVLTRALRMRPVTRPAVRAVPTIIRNTSRHLTRRAANGQPISRQIAGRVMAAQTRRVLGNPRLCATAITRNVRAASTAARSAPGQVSPRRACSRCQ